jgi:hypothetical protein
LYEVDPWQGGIDPDGAGGPLFWDEGTLDHDAKPLIETKFEIKRIYESHLTDFVGAAAKHLRVDQPRNAHHDDCPF